ncbi:MAG: acyl-CoA synthetase [Sneathiellaceae bacterium]
MPVWNPAVSDIVIRDASDIAAIERTPFEQITTASSAYEILGIHAAEHPDWPAIVFMTSPDPADPAVTLTFRQLFGRVTQSANLFHSLSDGAPPVVAQMMPAMPHAHMALWGGAAAGVAMPLNFLLRPDQLAELMNAAKVTVLVALGPHPAVDIWQKVLAVKDMVPSLKAVVQVTGEVAPGLNNVHAFDAAVGGQPADRLVSGRSFALDDIAAYFHTGGTTGAPKLAQHTNRNHVAMAFGVSRMWGFEPQKGILNGLPIFHVGGALDAGLAPLAAGGHFLLATPAGLRDPRVVQNIWRIAEHFKLDVVGGVPTSIVAMAQVPVGEADISCVKMALTGGSPMPVEPARQFEKRFGIRIHEIYGMTETSGNGTVNPRHGERVVGCAGLRVPYVELMVAKLGPDGTPSEDCAPEETGVVMFRGPTVTPGYTDPRRNEGVVLDDGWLVSGDLGRIAADGRLWITGRAKDLIIRSGHNIDPAIIEAAMDAHPAVLNSAAIGMPDEYAGELPAIYVTLKEGAKATEQELHDWLAEHISERPALPKAVHIIPEMPLTGVGKIFKPALRWDSTRQVFEARLADLAKAHGVTAQVAVGEVPGTGIVATITLAGTPDDKAAVEGAVSERLGAFTLQPWRLAWA